MNRIHSDTNLLSLKINRYLDNHFVSIAQDYLSLNKHRLRVHFYRRNCRDVPALKPYRLTVNA